MDACMALQKMQDLISKTDFKHRIPEQQWWMSLRPLISVLAKHKEHIFLGEQHQASQ